ncbi:transketolase [Candidatus Pacearchaeota archaeon CG10_big_fil_rev_8_21_14_0_10_34_76]|nr:MAG: transketolase [Candidatus Pacearchaeota archaeon CG10_big_fil_rev_8_21_14_0_10_34_76]
MVDKKELVIIADILRRDSIVSTTIAGSGHPTSCLSCAEILSVLFFDEMSYDVKNALNPDNDEFILSKGHAAPILYSALFRSGCIDYGLSSLRKLNSPLQGHPMPSSLKWIKVATGSLGQGLSAGIGMALASKMRNSSSRTYVLLGDSELAEGSNYEALQLASKYNLNNLCAIVDINRLGQRGETMVGHNIDTYKKRFLSFGWNTISIDGHSIPQIYNTFSKARISKKPTIILAKTYKGKGVSFLENKENWHGKVLNQKEMDSALKEIPDENMPKVKIKRPQSKKTNPIKFTHIFPNYLMDEQISTREAYGIALAKLTEKNPQVIALDSEVSNSTMSEKVKEKTPEQFIETYIAEQNMISIALGLSKKGFVPFASTFSAFLSRAHDQIRMSALSLGNFTICGSHSGVSIGQDGASQMGLEDIALFRSIPNSTIFYPSDAVSTEKLVSLSATLPNIKYIRTTRQKTKILYQNDEKFLPGEFKTLKSSTKDRVVLIGAGITLHECLKAHDELKKQNIHTSVIDLYCIKPFNSKKLIDFAKKHGNKLIIVEDHYKAGGIGEMISSALVNSGIRIKSLHVSGIPHSGQPSELLHMHKIDSRGIIEEVRSFN